MKSFSKKNESRKLIRDPSQQKLIFNHYLLIHSRTVIFCVDQSYCFLKTSCFFTFGKWSRFVFCPLILPQNLFLRKYIRPMWGVLIFVFIKPIIYSKPIVFIYLRVSKSIKVLCVCFCVSQFSILFKWLFFVYLTKYLMCLFVWVNMS
jgi:hypothetical protein